MLESFNLLKELEGQSHKFSILTRELELLAGLLQTENLTFKNVLAFNEKPEVKASVERLKKEFSNELMAETEGGP